MITGKFENGDRGPICRHPSDNGAWLVPDRGVAVELEVEYVFEITGTINSGRLRFVRVIETVNVHKLRMREKYVPLILTALRDPSKVGGTYNPYGSSGVTVSVEEGHLFYLSSPNDRLSFYNRMALAPFLLCSELNVKFRRSNFPVIEVAMEKAHLDYEAKLQREQQECAAREAERNVATTKARAEQVAKDAPLIFAFFADHPEATKWFSSNTLTWNEVSEEAVKRGLAKFIREESRGSYSTFSKGMHFINRFYSLPVGGKEIEVQVFCTIEDYGDD